jgi:hypothetical protein
MAATTFPGASTAGVPSGGTACTGPTVITWAGTAIDAKPSTARS